jgi:hypothetical protein
MNNKFIKVLPLLIMKSAILMAGTEPADVSRESDTKAVIILPYQYESLPPKIIHTGETQIETEIFDHYIERHIWQSEEGYPPVYQYKYWVKRHIS